MYFHLYNVYSHLHIYLFDPHSVLFLLKLPSSFSLSFPPPPAPFPSSSSKNLVVRRYLACPDSLQRLPPFSSYTAAVLS